MSTEGNEQTVNIQIKAIQIGDITYPQECDLVVSYVNGMKEGKGTVISAKKTTLAKLNYHEDMLDGLCSFYDSKGRKIYDSVYHKGEMREALFLNTDQMKKYEFNGKIMKEYENDSLVYNGEFEGSIEKGYTRNGIGTVFISEEESFIALFEKGIEKRRIRECSEGMMKEFDDKGRIIYIGGYDKNEDIFLRRDGLVYEYDEQSLKEVYDCENGEKREKKYDFRLSIMREFNEDGKMIYEGGYIGTVESGFWRNGKGDEYNDNGELIYSGEWKDGERKGKGKYYHDGSLIYEGKWSKGKPNGRGKYYQNDKVVKEGEWKNGYLHLQGSKWFNYLNGKEEKVIALKKGGLVKWLKGWISIEEVENAKKSREVMNVCISITIGIVVVCLLLLSIFGYYLYCILRTDAIIHNEFDMMLIGKNVKRIVVNEGVGNGMSGDLSICDYPYLEELYVKGNSLMNLDSLKISNNPLMNNITVADYSYDVSSSVMNLVLKSLNGFD